jgi:uncharacterized membrane protein
MSMTYLYLIAGLLLFLGVHSTRIFADGWRSRTRERMGANSFKGVYALVSLAGLVLLVWGYGVARQQPVVLWMPPVAMRHVAALLTLLAFVLLAASIAPMVLGVKVWALAHLLANGTLGAVLLFGSFLVWAIVLFAASRRRDRRERTVYAPGTGGATGITMVAGVLAWVAFAFWLHRVLIGVAPFG